MGKGVKDTTTEVVKHKYGKEAGNICDNSKL